jgi:tRNA (Thr-GGU) A37 N-methylase
MAEKFQVEAIGWVRSSRKAALDDNWDSVTASIELDTAQFDRQAMAGLDAFSYVEVIFLFDQVDPGDVQRGARRPRGNPDWPEIGIFAQRARKRPNRIGSTICRIVAVDGTRLYVAGLDAIDATPVLDIKPVMQGFLPRGDVAEPDWARQLMRDYW